MLLVREEGREMSEKCDASLPYFRHNYGRVCHCGKKKGHGPDHVCGVCEQYFYSTDWEEAEK